MYLGETKKYIFTSITDSGNGLENVHDVFKVEFQSSKKEEVLISTLTFPMSKDPMPCYLYKYSPAKNSYQYLRHFYSYHGDFVHARNSLQDHFRSKNALDLIVFDHGYDYPPYPGGKVVFFREEGDEFIEDKKFLDYPSSFSFGGCSGDWDNDGFPELLVFNLCVGESDSLMYRNDMGKRLVPAGERLPDFLKNRQFVALGGTKFRDANNKLHLALGSMGNHFTSPSDLILVNDGNGYFPKENVKFFPKRRKGEDWGCVNMIATNFSGAFKNEGILAVYHDKDVQNGYIEFHVQDENLNFSFFDRQIPLFETENAWISKIELVKISSDSNGFDGIIILKHRGLRNFIPQDTYVSLLAYDKVNNKFVDMSEELLPLKGLEFKSFVEFGARENKTSRFVFFTSEGHQFVCHPRGIL